MTTYIPLSNSTFLEYAGWGVADQSLTVQAAYGGLADAEVFPNDGPPPRGINLAIVLERANDPTTMLAGDWGSRQAAIAALNATDSLWTTYGTDPGTFSSALSFLQTTLNLTVLDGTTIPNGVASNYITSAASRTIWVEINTQDQWQSLFGPDSTLMYSATGDGHGPVYFWEGSLSLASELSIDGLWLDQSTKPLPSNMAPGVSVTLPDGWQAIGNSLGGIAAFVDPQIVADTYNFPLTGADFQTGTIGLIEPANGSYVSSSDPTGSTFQTLLTDYLTGIHTAGTGTVFVQGADGQVAASGERSLDIGISAAVNPNSDIALYVGSGASPATGNARSSVYTVVQNSIWGTASNFANTATVDAPPVVSSSWSDFQRMAPGSPFYNAYMQLYVDAALMNQTNLIAQGDGGSGGEIGNGLKNVNTNSDSPYAIMVGGTSTSNVFKAEQDTTLNDGPTSLYQLALAQDLQTIWQLVSGGLSQMPTAGSVDWLVEVAWNEYETASGQFVLNHAYTDNNSSGGGVDYLQGEPVYQHNFGLDSSIYDDLGLGGRALPDVSAPAGGNIFYLTPEADMTGRTGEGGTSAATPFWAGLITQINYVFGDQSLPNLGYMTDLLYLAAVVAPGSFNDVTIGANTSSFSMEGTAYGGLNPTGLGNEAKAGYDLVTGLGSPNGLLLARALTEIAHSQIYYSATVPGVSTAVPDVIDAAGVGAWTSGTAQTLLLQTTATAQATVTVDTDGDPTDASSAAHDAFAWTSQLAQQSLQHDFDPDVLALFDGQTQGTLTQAIVADGDSVAVSFNGTTTVAAQANLSASFGFADFFSDRDNYLRVAQSVAVAETANHADDFNVVVRMRQVAGADLSLMLYKVDDYNGTIDGVAPDQAGYAALAAAAAYDVKGGGSVIAGPGNGNSNHVEITGVDAGDLIAMQLTNVTNGDTFWAFSQANEVVGGEHVSHLWNYGANTWGWEDLHGGGDRDFNDLVVQLDFTSTAGSGLLVT